MRLDRHARNGRDRDARVHISAVMLCLPNDRKIATDTVQTSTFPE